MTTIEGLRRRLAPGAAGVVAEQATMCGCCEPGFIMAIAALIEASPSRRRADRGAAQYLPLRRLSAHPKGDCARRAKRLPVGAVAGDRRES